MAELLVFFRQSNLGKNSKSDEESTQKLAVLDRLRKKCWNLFYMRPVERAVMEACGQLPVEFFIQVKG